MKTKILLLAVLAIAMVQIVAAVSDNAATQVFSPVLWHEGELYGTVVTPTEFHGNAPLHSFDALYNFGDSGLDGQRSVIEAAPEDPDYNGGRWIVYPVSFTESGLAEFDTDDDGVIDAEFESEQAVLDAEAAGYITIGDAVKKFVCTVNKLHE